MIREPLMLAPDVLCVPIGALPAEVRTAIPCADGDFALTRAGSRDRTKVIGAPAAQFLAVFRNPTTILNAVIQHGAATGRPPERLLEESFQLLQTLVNNGWLATPGTVATRPLEPILAPGSRFAGWEVGRCIQVLEDTEIHQACDSAGRVAAIKLWRTPSPDAEREAAILSRLDGSVNPSLFTASVEDGHPYLIAEWVEGETAAVVADRLRVAHAANRVGLLRLAVRIATAYAGLHAQKVLHGDVHPRNVLVSAAGEVRLVDYGYARLLGSGSDWCRAARGGIGFFAEPELASRRLRGQSPPQATPEGEQYSLAAMLYFLITGNHYADFSLDKATQYRQVVEQPPLPFAGRGQGAWPELEACLARALRKEPSERFGSVAEFATVLASVLPSLARPSPRSEREAQRNRVQGGSLLPQLRAEFRARFVRGGPGLCRGPIEAPRSSVKFGAAGIAYALYRMSCLEDDAELLALADTWAVEAARAMERPEGFTNRALDITPQSIGSISLYHSPTGVFVVQALLAHARGDVVTWDDAAARFIAHGTSPSPNLDLALGRAGVLLGATLLSEAVPSDLALASFGETLKDDILARVMRLAPIREESRVKYLGIAHGWAGILYALLRWEARRGRVSSGVVERLNQLAECGESAADGVWWPRQVRGGRRQQDFLSGWCHGTAGYVYLWTLAHRALREGTYAALAEGAARATHADADRMTNLCCGLAGRAYALLHWYKHTGETKWLDAARELGELAAAEPPDASFSDVSLYKGRLGVALLGADLEHPGSSCLPLFEGEGWPATGEIFTTSRLPGMG